MKNCHAGLLVISLLSLLGCRSPDNPAYLAAINAAARAANRIDYWVTLPDQRLLLKKQKSLQMDTPSSKFPTITVDSNSVFQSIEGFGYTLTGGSATLIHGLEPAARKALLTELFGLGENAIGVSYLRLSIGASDLSEEVYSYDDVADGGKDPELKSFNILNERTHLLPVLREILAINPSIKIMGSPWSAPAWMKTNNSSVGGSLKKEYMEVYAHYLVKYIQKMKTEGVTIDAITPQNEPLHDGNNPSMLMEAEDQAVFIGEFLGPAFKNAGIDTKIIIYDHNCNKPEYPLTVLSDTKAKGFVDGTAFHLYAGDVSALSQVYNEHPDRNIYFTERYTSNSSSFAEDLSWHMKNVIIGTTKNWSKTALEWNLANNSSWGPHTPGGCTTCKGALTIDGATITRNVSYYIIAHAAKFVRPGSLRIGSSEISGIQQVAFKRPDGKKVLIALNETTSDKTFNIRYRDLSATATLQAGATASFMW